MILKKKCNYQAKFFNLQKRQERIYSKYLKIVQMIMKMIMIQSKWNLRIKIKNSYQNFKKC